MEYIIENEQLKVTVTTWGAQVKSVRRKCDGVEHMWSADKAVWGYHAPILFPYTGKVKDGIIQAKGQTFEHLPQHGFARTSEHTLVRQSPRELVLELRDSEATRAVWPYGFRLLSTFTLEGDTLHHTLTVENRDQERMPFGIGYHPAFKIPFDDAHEVQDYELRFDRAQNPLCLSMLPRGLFSGKTYYLPTEGKAIPLNQELFSVDSHCMTGLNARTLGVYEKGSNRAVVCDIRDFPYTLIWSKPGEMKFICIEPWQSLPSPEKGGYQWDEKPAAAVLEPGEVWSTTLTTSFRR